MNINDDNNSKQRLLTYLAKKKNQFAITSSYLIFTLLGNFIRSLSWYCWTNSLQIHGKDKPSLHASHHVTATTFLMIGIITTNTLFVFTLVLNQNHTAMAHVTKSPISNAWSFSFFRRPIKMSASDLSKVFCLNLFTR